MANIYRRTLARIVKATTIVGGLRATTKTPLQMCHYFKTGQSWQRTIDFKNKSSKTKATEIMILDSYQNKHQILRYSPKAMFYAICGPSLLIRDSQIIATTKKNKAEALC